ncbi:MAG TPA: polysaccharide deacetylase family protein [Candidatus Eremiobacteraceae bacterium]|nr:polysaccharide deacetylase family protein [Candidatus Eremiobacteraceae bacterium]
MNIRRAALIIVVLAAVVAAAWYFFEAPFNQTFGTTVTQVLLQQKIVALTFDDGPNPPFTNEIVDYLHSVHVPATFFVVGKAVQAHPDIVRTEVRDGDAVGNHSWDHAHLILLSKSHVERELDETEDEIFRVTGVHTALFRPPFGARDFLVLRIARDRGYKIIMWSVPLPGDWTSPPPAVIARRVLKYVKNGSIIVLHDGNKGGYGNRTNTVAATKLIVQDLLDQGYRFVTVPELMRLGYDHESVPAGPREGESMP